MTEKEALEQKLNAIRDLIMSAEKSVAGAKRMLNDVLGKKNKKGGADLDTSDLHAYKSGEETIIEGVFTGDQMLGSDKQMYPVPANYASKSMIVQGSKLKAIIAPSGKITYKIIEEMPYATHMAVLVKDNGEYQVVHDGNTYTVLGASVTYFGANVGDMLVIRIPEGKKATFAAVESVAPKDVDPVEVSTSGGEKAEEKKEETPEQPESSAEETAETPTEEKE